MKKKDMPRSVDYYEYMVERLRDPKRAEGYLKAVYEDCADGSEESKQVIEMSLKIVEQAQSKNK